MLALGLHAQFIAFEGNAGRHGYVQLLLIIAGGLQRLPGDLDQRAGLGQLEVALRRAQRGVLALGLQGLVGGS